MKLHRQALERGLGEEFELALDLMDDPKVSKLNTFRTTTSDFSGNLERRCMVRDGLLEASTDLLDYTKVS